jgi:hypothetical protein
MPINERVIITTKEIAEDTTVSLYWMDYETGIDLAVLVPQQLRDAIANDPDLAGRVTVEDIKPAIPILQHERDFIEKVCDAVNVYVHDDAQFGRDK